MASYIKQSDTTYRLTVSCGYDAQGRQVRKRKTVKVEPDLTPKQLEKELERLCVLFDDEVKTGGYNDEGNIKLEAFSLLWLENHVRKDLAPGTVVLYEDILKDKINPALGHIRLNKLTPIHIIEFYKALSAPGLRRDKKYLLMTEYRDTDFTGVLHCQTIKKLASGGEVGKIAAGKAAALLGLPISATFAEVNQSNALPGSYARRCHTVLTSMLSSAVKWQYIAANPCARVETPKSDRRAGVRREAKHYEDHEAADLLSRLETTPIKYQCAVYIALFGGLRLGEIAALTWADIDFEKCLVRINKQRQYIYGRGVIESTPKTVKSNRIIPLPAIVFDKLREYKRAQTEIRLKLGSLWRADDIIFTNIYGKPTSPSTLSRWFNGWLKKEGMPHLKFHGLRHSAASLMIAEGADVAAVSRQLGHADIYTTTSIYTHAIQSKQVDAANKIGEWAERVKAKNGGGKGIR